MDIADLRQFVVLAGTQHVGQAAEVLNLSPSAVSKALGRLEQAMHTQLFHRVGRGLQLNAAGERLLQRCQPLLQEFDQLSTEMQGGQGAFTCRIAGPALLQLRWGSEITRRLAQAYPQCQVHYGDYDERSALAAVIAGQADVGLVTQPLISPQAQVPPDDGVVTWFAAQAKAHGIEPLSLGRARFAVAIGQAHPLYRGNGEAVAVEAVLAHDFVAPSQPHFQVLDYAPATDGWRDDAFPRRIRYRSDDLLMVDGLVRRNLALAYLPEDVITELGLSTLTLTGYPYQYEVAVLMFYRPSRAHGWLYRLVSGLGSRTLAPS